MLHFVYNPIAGKGKAEKLRLRLAKRLTELGVPGQFHATRSRGDAIAIVRRLTHGGDRVQDIVAMGGDGTLNEVLNGIEDPARVRLGLIPCGSGNDFASAAGIPTAPEAALALLLNGEAKYTDYMECAGVRGINVIGAGIDVDILRRYARMKLLKGRAGYLLSLIQTLLRFKFYALDEIRNGARVSHKAFIACAGNGRRYGGGIAICPEAAIDDGLLDIVIVDDLKKTAMPGGFLKLLQGRVLELPCTQFRRDTALRIASNGPLPIQIDGEIYEDLPFDVRIVSRQLRMYRP